MDRDPIIYEELFGPADKPSTDPEDLEPMADILEDLEPLTDLEDLEPLPGSVDGPSAGKRRRRR
jgi:hypothetical protein